MTIEEKAKAYDEAIERANSLLSSNELGNAWIYKLLPELKESEDEIMVKFIKNQLFNIKKTITDNYELDAKLTKAIDWLEKQGKNPVDKIEPKFKVKYAGSEYNVLEVKDIAGVTYYGIEDEPNHIDYVLPDNCEIVSEQKPVNKIKPKFKIGDTVTVKPMSCHGKAFKGEPFKIVDIIEDNYVSDDGKTYSISLQDGWELVEQKPAEWIQELEYKLANATPEQLAEWKEKYFKVEPVEWSEEDENRINRLIAYFEDKESFTAEDDIVYANWLKSLRPQNRWKPSDGHYELEEFAKIVRCNLTGISKAV